MKNFSTRILLTFGLMITFSTTAFAYIDPSVVTYSIQIVAGVVVAVGAVIGICWRKAKKKVQDKLGIDENTNKEVEEDVVEIIEESEKKQEN